MLDKRSMAIQDLIRYLEVSKQSRIVLCRTATPDVINLLSLVPTVVEIMKESSKYFVLHRKGLTFCNNLFLL